MDPHYFIPNPEDIRIGYECAVRRLMPMGLMERLTPTPETLPRFSEAWYPVTIGVSHFSRLKKNADWTNVLEAVILDKGHGSRPIYHDEATGLIEHGMLKTEYLKRAIIESNGWIQNTKQFWLKQGFSMTYGRFANIATINKDSNTVFSGTIRCINDLRLIEKMIGIS